MYVGEIKHWEKDNNLNPGRDRITFSLNEEEDKLKINGNKIIKKVFAKHLDEVKINEMTVEVPSSKVCQIIIFLKDKHNIKTAKSIDLIKLAIYEIKHH